MSEMNIFNESVKLYKDKKDKCTQFIEKVENLVKDYEVDFPPLEGKSINSKSAVFHEIYEKLLNEKLKILVAGQFKAGKSTLINALLGEEVLPAYSTPCTAVITEIVYGEQKKAVISFKKQIMSVPDSLPQKVKLHIGDRRENIPDLVIELDSLGSELEKYLAIPEDEDSDQKEAVAESPYSCCRLSWPLELCRNDVEIIDSPGLNEAEARDETTYKFVPQADLVLHVMSALQFFGKPDKEFLAKLQNFGISSVIFLVNRFDLLNDQKDQDKVTARAIRELKNNKTKDKNDIFFVSSWLALTGRIDKDEEKYKNSGFKDFEAQLSNIIKTDRIKIKLGKSISVVCNELNTIINKFIPNLRTNLDKNLEDLEKKYLDRQNDFAKLENKKNLIQCEIEKGMNDIKKSFYSDLFEFFIKFAENSIDDAISDSSIKIKFFKRKKSVEEATRILSNDLFEALLANLKEFNQRKSKDVEIIINKMRKNIDEELKEFNKIIESICVHMNMKYKDNAMSFEKADDIVLDEFIGEAFVGALFGAGYGGFALFAAQFFAIGGPVIWTVAIVGAILGVLVSLLDGSSAEKKLKEKFSQEAAKKMRSEAESWAEKLSQKMAESLDEQKKLIIDTLERRIDDIKLPIEEAIRSLKENQGNIDEKKRQLEDWQTKFSAALEECDKLKQSILPDAM